MCFTVKGQLFYFGFWEATFFLTFGEMFHTFWGKNHQNTQNWENKGHFWIGNDSLILPNKEVKKPNKITECRSHKIYIDQNGIISAIKHYLAMDHI